ncbi:hypothetical protein DFH94DRAFT_408100 [Russula ochroleuca]|uniref:Uncharacterized protein n=1 Tax=Russula ochroleuca TaxID=152965 RepID=A0A9P5MYA0_9AGAM|nr:hypothetical protein DFH94DRAFT_408100 [Russula ochroleuca]
MMSVPRHILAIGLSPIEGANAARGVMNATVVFLVVLATGCTGFLASIAVLSLTWLVPSIRKPPPEILEKPHRRTSRVQPQEPPLPMLVYKEAEPERPEPRPASERHVSFDEPASTVPSPAPVSAPSSPRGRLIPLPRCRSRTVHSGAVPPACAAVALDTSPLSSAETLTEAPTEIKRAFSGRLTRVLPWGRSSTMGSTATSSPSAAVVSEFGEHVIAGEKRPNVTQRGRFGFLKKTRTIDVRIRGAERASRSSRRPPPLTLPSPASFTSNILPSPDSITSSRRTNSPSPVSSRLSLSSEQSQHRRVMSTPSASPKLRITDKLCPRKEKDRAAEPKPKPARTQPYGPPYNWIPPTPGAWAVAEEADERLITGRRRKRVSAPAEAPSLQDFTRHEPERSGGMPMPNPAVQ